MKKKLLSFILSLVVICSIMPIDISYAATTISAVAITDVDAPIAGKNPDYVAMYGTGYGANSSADDNGTINGVTWFDSTGNSELEMKAGDVFEYGHTYIAAFYIKVSNGYEFRTSPKISATINGNAATAVITPTGDNASNAVVVRYEFSACENERIKEVAVNGLDAPKVDATPDDSAVVDGDNYSIQSIDWYDETDRITVKSTDVFKANHEYSVSIWLRVAENYKFATDEGSLDITGKLNGMEAEIPIVEVETVAELKFNFGVCNAPTITTVSVSGIDLPLDGESPDWTMIPGATGYTYKTGGMYPYGVEWYDETAGEGLYPEDEDKFVAGHEYTVYVWLQTEAGYTFSTTSGKINGQTVTISGSDTTETVLSYTYLCTGVVSDVDISIVAPVAGNKPDFTKIDIRGCSSVGSVSPYKNGIKWYNNTDEKSMISGTTSIFEEEKTYLVTIVLNTKEGFGFAPTVRAKVNGDVATVSRVSDECVNVEYIFTVPHKCSLTEVPKVEPKCSETGKQAYYHCDKCGNNYEDTEGITEITNLDTWGIIAAKGHDEEVIPAKAATCTTTGLTEGKKCKVCNTVTVKQNVVAKLKHTTTTATTPATLIVDGKKVETCSLCKEVIKTDAIAHPKTIKLNKTKFVYNGKAQKPSVVIKDTKGNDLKLNTDYTVKYAKGCKESGKYSVTITFKGNYKGTKKLNFTIIPKATSKLTAKRSGKTITLTWKKVKSANGYKIYQYNKKTKKYKNIATIKKASTLKYKIKGIKKGTEYQFKVVAYKKVGSTTILGNEKIVKVKK